MIRLTTKGLVMDASPAEVAALREEFERFHTVKLPGLMGPDLMALLFGQVHKEDFETKTFGEFSLELAVMQNVGVHSLQLLMNDNRMRAAMEQITGCTPLRYFSGRIYRLEPNSAHHTDWHDDAAGGDRRVGISFNLSQQPYDGGCFEIKRQTEDQIIRAMPNLTLGDAILFRIDRKLEHRVTAVTGTRSKTAFAGWYHDTADLTDMLRCMPKATA